MPETKTKNHDADLQSMSGTQLRRLLLKMRTEIRWHRDQRGDDRCWLDDIKIYKLLPEYVNPYQSAMPARSTFMGLCSLFEQRRQDPTEKKAADSPIPNWKDEDAKWMSNGELLEEVILLRSAIRKHQSKGFYSRNWKDDHELYMALPEKIGAVTKLPHREIFLKNCARFCDSRDPKNPNLHEW